MHATILQSAFLLVTMAGLASALALSPEAPAPAPKDAENKPAAKPAPATKGELPGWKLTFADEFDAPEGAAPDPTKWTYDLGGHGWGNNELQCYTDSRENSFHDGKGNLVIRAKKQSATGKDGTPREYTSARLLTKGIWSQKYGRFEARIKCPKGQGIWPAFWMLGDNIAEKNWPACGEIDIMEYLGHDTMTAYGTVHGPGYSGADSKGKPFKLTKPPSFHDDFHVFAVEWEKDQIRFSINGEEYHRISPKDLEPNPWVFDTPFFMILNMAVGGNWPKNPDETTTFPQELVIDHVRAYSR
jgi:beta-glucanase (GH16 family)